MSVTQKQAQHSPIFLIRKLISSVYLTFNSQKWLTHNFSQQYSYNIQQAGNESTQTYQIKVDVLLFHHTLATNCKGNM